MGDQKTPKYKHAFSDEELDKLMYLWDDKASSVVHEYLYMKKSWRHGAEGSQSLDNKEGHDLKQGAIDTGDRTEVDLTKKDNSEDEEIAYLELDTEESVHVVEFYAPWCPHCLLLRSEYIELAGELSRRSIGIPVEFHAVSCDLFRMVCRAYGIKGFPVVLGYRVGMDINEKGIELNPVDGPSMTAETIASDLELSLANEPMNVTSRNFTNSDDRRAYEEEQAQMAKRAAEMKSSWQSYASTSDERYHNAAVSLAFVLKNGVYIQREDRLDDIRALALKEFLELLDWTTPQAWRIRSGMIRDLLDNLQLIVSGYTNLVEIVDRHIAVDTGDSLWGGLHGNVVGQASSSQSLMATLILNNTKFTKACTHSERTLGFTCGLWNLFHIATVGSSLPDHQLYGFLSGYLTSPVDIAEILKRFIDHFFGCEVCRSNFLNNYDNCGQNHCERLPTITPLLEKDETLQWEARVELARWLMEMHNAVNVRLMYESAEREDRIVTPEERLSAIFPPVDLCRDCWLDENLTEYEPQGMVRFLHHWYWPEKEVVHQQFQITLSRHLTRSSRDRKDREQSSYSWLPLSIGGLLILLFILWRSGMYRARPHTTRKSV
jgi:thiol-disulfide isomerase/thioredoxin